MTDCTWCGHPDLEHHADAAIDPDGPVLTDNVRACLRCHVCYPDRETLAASLEASWEAARRRHERDLHVAELRLRVADSPHLVAIVDALEQRESAAGTGIDEIQAAALSLRLDAMAKAASSPSDAAVLRQAVTELPRLWAFEDGVRRAAALGDMDGLWELLQHQAEGGET